MPRSWPVPFGVHPYDEARAKTAIRAAKESGADFADFLAQIYAEFKRKKAKMWLDESAKSEAERARKMWDKL